MAENLERRGATYYLRIKIHGRLYRKSTGFTDYQLARRRATELEHEIRKGILGWDQPRIEIPTVDAWATRYALAYRGESETLKFALRRVTALWKGRRLDGINRSDCELYVRDRLAAGAARSTVERERVTIKAMFRGAVDDGLLKSNPWAGVKRIRSEARTRVMSYDEEARIRAIAKPPQWLRYLDVALNTGLRAQEQRMLRPCDLRQSGAWAWVRPESNKTRRGRLVPLRPEVLAALEAQRAWQVARAVSATPTKQITPETPYFDVSEPTARRALRRWCEALSIAPHITIHDLRRTFATRCAQLGMWPGHLQRILGHADLSTTMRFYIHMDQQSAADSLLKLSWGVPDRDTAVSPPVPTP